MRFQRAVAMATVKKAARMAKSGSREAPSTAVSDEDLPLLEKLTSWTGFQTTSTKNLPEMEKKLHAIDPKATKQLVKRLTQIVSASPAGSGGESEAAAQIVSASPAGSGGESEAAGPPRFLAVAPPLSPEGKQLWINLMGTGPNAVEDSDTVVSQLKVR
jgi:hypothetical protein